MQRPSTEWIVELDRAGIPASPVNTLDLVAQDPQILHRHMVQDMPFEGAQVRLVGNPIRVSGADPNLISPPPPVLGEHTASVRHQALGLSDEEIDGLVESGAVSRGRGHEASDQLSAPAIQPLSN